MGYLSLLGMFFMFFFLEGEGQRVRQNVSALFVQCVCVWKSESE